MTAFTGLKDWNPGDSNRSRAHLQEPVDAIRQLQGVAAQAAGGGPDTSPEPDRNGLGEDRERRAGWRSYAAPRRGRARFHGCALLAAAAVNPVRGCRRPGKMDTDTTDQISYQSPPNIFPATNWPERKVGSHCSLTDGTIEVMYFGVYDAGSPQQKHYVFYRGLPETARFQVTHVDGGNTFRAQRYKADGSSLDGTDVYIRRRQAHYVGQDVIATRPASGPVSIDADETLQSTALGGTDAAPEWEEIHAHPFVLVWVDVPGDGVMAPAEIAASGWYKGTICHTQQTLPTTWPARRPRRRRILPQHGDRERQHRQHHRDCSSHGCSLRPRPRPCWLQTPAHPIPPSPRPPTPRHAP
jgi:hypothetical protein